MFYRLRSKYKKARFYRLTAEILETPPMPVVNAPWSIISMVAKSDVQMYLLSLKSFYSYIGRGKIVAIIDRDLPQDSRDLLKRHFPGIRFVILEDIDTGICQRGGTWERVLHLVDHSREEYAIQIDCDTLTFGHDIDEVLHCVANNIPFTLGSGGNPIESMSEAASRARRSEGNFVGLAAERLFDRYPNAEGLKYVRGSSGFAGFAKNGISREMVEDFHRNMEKLLGARWTEWGTEQCASNFAIANSPNAVVMQRPKYGNFSPGINRAMASFLHFYGTHRYEDDFFAKRGLDVIAALKSPKKSL